MPSPNFQQSQDNQNNDQSDLSQTQGDIQDPGNLDDGSNDSDDGDNSSQSDSTTSDPSSDVALLTQVAQNATRQNQILQQQLQQLQQQMDGVSRSVQQNNPPRPIVTDEDFQTAPAAAMERLLDHKLGATIAPLLEEQRNNQRVRTVNSMLPQIISSLNPNAVGYAPAIAPAVLEILGTADPTPQNIQMAAIMAIGRYALTGAPPQDTTQTPNGTENNQVRRPSTPPNIPNNAPRTKPVEKIKLNEQQRRLFKTLGYKDGQEAEFIKFLEADEVTFQ